jgi:hypothetical protein
MQLLGRTKPAAAGTRTSIPDFRTWGAGGRQSASRRIEALYFDQLPAGALDDQSDDLVALLNHLNIWTH